MLQPTAEFVVSAAGENDFPRDGAAEVALIGRSNVGKSSLINALVRRTVARTSAAPGKTRLINFYRVRAPGWPVFYFADLPGYGYARGGDDSSQAFERLADAYFGRTRRVKAALRCPACTLLVIDARRSPDPRDRAALAWAAATGSPVVVVASKIDKLTRAARTEAEREWKASYEYPVAPVSSATGEGLKGLWTLIGELVREPGHRS